MTDSQLTELLLWIAKHADALNDIAVQTIALSAEAVTEMPVQTPEQLQHKIEATRRLFALKSGYDKLAESARKIEQGLYKGEVNARV